MIRTLCIANQKAGVGKTATSVNLGMGLARAGLRTLIVDLDPRGPATQHVGRDLGGRAHTKQQLRATYVDGCDLLTGFERGSELSKQRLEEWLSELDEKAAYDFVLLDCPPTAAEQTSWALRAAKELLMPVCCDDFGMDGIEEFVAALRRAVAEGSQIEFSSVVLTRSDGTAKAVETEQQAREFFGEVVLETIIPSDSVIEDARRSRRAVMDVAPRSRGTRAYLELCREVIER